MYIKVVLFSIGYLTNKNKGWTLSGCYYQGKYCKDEFGSYGHENSGREVIDEQLRQ